MRLTAAEQALGVEQATASRAARRGESLKRQQRLLARAKRERSEPGDSAMRVCVLCVALGLVDDEPCQRCDGAGEYARAEHDRRVKNADALIPAPE